MCSNQTFGEMVALQLLLIGTTTSVENLGTIVGTDTPAMARAAVALLSSERSIGIALGNESSRGSAEGGDMSSSQALGQSIAIVLLLRRSALGAKDLLA